MDRLGQQHSAMEFAPASTFTTRASRAGINSGVTHRSDRRDRTIEIRVEELPTYTRSDIELSNECLGDVKHTESKSRDTASDTDAHSV